QIQEAKQAKGEIVKRMDEVFAGADAICLPTTVSPAPLAGERISARSSLRPRNSALCCIAGTTGRPQISLPLGEVDGLPVGLSLIGERGTDEVLIAFAREVAATMGQQVGL
ncbi:MAG: amidase, partial [Chloroflexi bacterium]|nr:amidase [Chloroflexota bacterium]